MQPANSSRYNLPKLQLTHANFAVIYVCEVFKLPSNSKRSTVRNYTIMDAGTGEVISEKTWYGSNMNGGGFCMIYTDETARLIERVTEPTILRVFFYVAMGQDYGTDGRPFGMVATKREIQNNLKLSERSVISAFNWLKENAVIHERSFHNSSEFMVNPRYVTVGKDKEFRMQEWARRWEVSGVFIRGYRKGTKQQSAVKSKSKVS